MLGAQKKPTNIVGSDCNGSVIERYKSLHLKTLHVSLRSHVVVLLNFGFVLDHLTVQFVRQIINRGVEVCVRTLGKQITSRNMNAALSCLPKTLFSAALNAE